MDLVWSPETASKAFIDTVKSCEVFQDSSVAELISAMAAGWNAKLLVQTWTNDGTTKTSIGLNIASSHTCGRHVCMVPDEQSKTEYVAAMGRAGMSPEVFVGDPEERFGELTGIDFLVVNCGNDDLSRILRVAKLGQKGAVMVCKDTLIGPRSGPHFRWPDTVGGGSRRLVRSVILPVGKGLDIAYFGAHREINKDSCSTRNNGRRWIKHIDKKSREEYIIRI